MAPLSQGGFAVGINNKGQILGAEVVGKAVTSGPEPHTYSLVDTFIFQNGVMTDLGRIGDEAEPTFINDNGEIVGTSFVRDIGNGRPFIYRDGKFQDLQSVVDSRYRLMDVVGLNDAGQIVVRADVPGPSSNREDTLLLTPTPEPSPLCLLAVPLFGLLIRRRAGVMR